MLTSGGLGTMGYGLPAGIGAKFAAPDRKVVVVSGDGSIQMNIQELGTAVQYNVDIKVIILNNYFLGMVRQWQEKLLPGALLVLRDVGAELRQAGRGVRRARLSHREARATSRAR